MDSGGRTMVQTDRSGKRAAALRANLQRRKAQARGRVTGADASRPDDARGGAAATERADSDRHPNPTDGAAANRP